MFSHGGILPPYSARVSCPNSWVHYTKVAELGVCAASIEQRAEGINGGRNGGRVCWAVTGTLCGGKVQGTFARKLANCLLDCAFFKSVLKDEKKNLDLYPSFKNRPQMIENVRQVA
jgi:hypothetical protein